MLYLYRGPHFIYLIRGCPHFRGFPIWGVGGGGGMLISGVGIEIFNTGVPS